MEGELDNSARDLGYGGVTFSPTSDLIHEQLNNIHQEVQRSQNQEDAIHDSVDHENSPQASQPKDTAIADSSGGDEQPKRQEELFETAINGVKGFLEDKPFHYNVLWRPVTGNEVNNTYINNQSGGNTKYHRKVTTERNEKYEKAGEQFQYILSCLQRDDFTPEIKNQLRQKVMDLSNIVKRHRAYPEIDQTTEQKEAGALKIDANKGTAEKEFLRLMNDTTGLCHKHAHALTGTDILAQDQQRLLNVQSPHARSVCQAIDDADTKLSQLDPTR